MLLCRQSRLSVTVLPQSLIIKRFGNIVKVYASCVASLFSAGISYSLLHDPPAPLFYAGCILAMVATLQLQRARAALAAGKPLEGSSSGSKALWAVVGITVMALVVAQGASRDAAALPGGSPTLQGGSGSTADGAGAAPLRRPTAAPPARERQHVMRQAPGPVTDEPMMVLPPFEPTCIATDLSHMASWGCPVMRCSQDLSCTVTNTSCCAHLNYEMLSTFDAFMSSKCMDDEFFVMFGSAIGALRDETILPHTEDVDLGLTPLALQFLELNASRAELWRHGYALWHHAEQGMGWWKMCPHRHHPSPAFQAAMVQEPVEITAKVKLTMPIYAGGSRAEVVGLSSVEFGCHGLLFGGATCAHTQRPAVAHMCLVFRAAAARFLMGFLQPCLDACAGMRLKPLPAPPVPETSCRPSCAGLQTSGPCGP